MAWDRNKRLKELEEIKSAIIHRREKFMSDIMDTNNSMTGVMPKAMQTPPVNYKRQQQLFQLPQNMASKWSQETRGKYDNAPVNKPFNPPYAQQQTPLIKPMYTPQGLTDMAKSSLKFTANRLSNEYKNKYGKDYKPKIDDKTIKTDRLSFAPVNTHESLMHNIVTPYKKPVNMYRTKIPVGSGYGDGEYESIVSKITVVGENKYNYFFRDKDGDLYPVAKSAVESEKDFSVKNHRANFLNSWYEKSGLSDSKTKKAFDLFSKSGASMLTGDENIMNDAQRTNNPVIDFAAQMGGAMFGLGFSPLGASPLEGGQSIAKNIPVFESGVKYLPQVGRNLINKIPKGGKLLNKVDDATGFLANKASKILGKNKVVDKIAKTADPIIRQAAQYTASVPYVSTRSHLATGDPIEKLPERLKRDAKMAAIIGGGFKAGGMATKGITNKLMPDFDIKMKSTEKIPGGLYDDIAKFKDKSYKGPSKVPKKVLDSIEKSKGRIKVDDKRLKTKSPFDPIKTNALKNTNKYAPKPKDKTMKFGMSNEEILKGIKENKKTTIPRKTKNVKTGEVITKNVKETEKAIKTFSDKEFNKKYRLDEDLSALPLKERMNQQSKIVSKIQEDIGEVIAKKHGTTDLKTIANEYVKKYNLPKNVKIVRNLKDPRRVARISEVVTDKQGNILNDSITIQINGKLPVKQQIAAMRHELQHYIDSVHSKGTFKATTGGTVSVETKTAAEYYKNFTKGHHKDYEWFEADYLRNAMKKELQGKIPVVNNVSTTNTVTGTKAKFETKIEQPKLTTNQLKQLETAKESYNSEMSRAKPFDNEMSAKIKKSAGMKYSAEKRRIIQGDSLETVEGGLTAKELTAKLAQEKKNYIGKKITVGGKEAEIIGNNYGKIKVKLEDGSTKVVKKEVIGSSTKDIKTQTQSLKQAKEAYEKNVDKSGISKFGETVRESGKTAKEFKEIIPKTEYQKSSNKEELRKSIERVSKDFEGVKESVYKKLADKTVKINDTDVIDAQVVMRKLQNEKKFDEANRILDDLRLRLTDSGKTIQAATFWNKMTPEGYLATKRNDLGKIKELLQTSKTQKIESRITKQNEQLEVIRKTIEKLKGKNNPAAKKEMKLNMELYENIERSVKKLENKLPAKYRNLTLTNEEQALILERHKQINMMPEGYKKTEAFAILDAAVASKIHPSFMQKVSTVQTMAQLLNLSTTGVNITGNTIMSGLDNASDVIGTGLDKIVKLRTGERSTFFPNIPGQIKAGAKETSKAFKEVLKGIDTTSVDSKYGLPVGNTFNKPKESWYKGPNGIKGGIDKTVNSILAIPEKGLNITLKVPDKGFFKASHERALKNELFRDFYKTNKRVPTKAEKAFLMKNGKVTQDMVDVAVLEGRMSTFQDDTIPSHVTTTIKRLLNTNIFKTIAKTSKSGKLTVVPGEWGLGDAIIKYPKIPGNLLARGIDYSPAGVAKGILKASVNAYHGNPFNQREFVRDISRGTTGTLLFLIGGALADAGIIKGARLGNYKIDEFQEDIGQGEFTFNVDAFKRYAVSGLDPSQAKIRDGDTIHKYDWTAPFADPIALGANISTAKKQRGKDKGKKNVAKRVGGTVIDILGLAALSIQTSIDTTASQNVLSGVREMFGKRQFSEGITEPLKSIPSSFVPTLSNQARKLVDNKRRKVGSDKEDFGLTETWNKIISKIPGLSKKLPEAITPTGENKTFYERGSVVSDILNSFVVRSPGKTAKETDSTRLLREIYDNTLETKQLPRQAAKRYTFEHPDTGEKISYNLSPAEQSDLQKYIGKKAMTELEQLEPNIKSMSDEDKIAEIEYVYNYIGREAKEWMYKKWERKLNR